MSSPSRPLTLRLARTAQDYSAFANLCREYAQWLRTRYRERSWFVEEVFSQQGFEQELTRVSAMYGPPFGQTLLACCGTEIVGGGAYRRAAGTACEMKRLFVRDAARGSGVGRRMAEHLIQAASTQGYTVMKLDTGARLTEALALYRSLGFREVGPYHAYPEHITRELVFMELALVDRPLLPR